MITAALATIPSREDTLEATVRSLLPQVDRVFVYLNGHARVPSCLRDRKIETVSSEDHGDRGDAGKFFWSNQVSGLHLTCDDDIVYPSDYATRMFVRASEYRIGLFGVLGARYVQPIRSYYRCRSPRYGVTYGLTQPVHVHMLGTGTLAFHPKAINFPDPVTVFPLPNMADVWLSAWAHDAHVPMICVDRPVNWLKPLPVKGPAIYDEYRRSRDDSVQTSVVASRTWPKLPDVPSVGLVVPPTDT